LLTKNNLFLLRGIMKFSTSTFLLISLLLFTNYNYGMEHKHAKTNLQHEITNLNNAVTAYNVNREQFPTRFYNWAFYVTAVGITAHSLYNNNHRFEGPTLVECLVYASLKGLSCGYAAYWCSWPFFPFAQWGFNKAYARPIYKSQDTITRLLVPDTTNYTEAHKALEMHISEQETKYPSRNALLRTQKLLTLIKSKKPQRMVYCSICHSKICCLTCQLPATAPPAPSPENTPSESSDLQSSPYSAFTSISRNHQAYPNLSTEE